MTNNERLALARRSLLGLSIGDAFGETFFGPEAGILNRIGNRTLQEGNWLFTDDTVMGIGIYNILSEIGAIDQDKLAKEFADNYLLDDYRGYGGTAHSILRAIAAGEHWSVVSPAVFDGMGSMGNGAAMRSGPIGAYFCDDPAMVIKQAGLSAVITHAHDEAIAGAIAVALAAHVCAGANKAISAAQFFDAVIPLMPECDLKYKLKKAATFPVTYDIRTIVSILGNGTQLTALDTVPFALWCAAHHLNDFAEALWTAVSGLGDRDTIGAIVGSIVVLSAPEETVPEKWIAQTEKPMGSPFLKHRIS